MNEFIFKQFVAKDLYRGRKLTLPGKESEYSKKFPTHKPVFDVAVCNLAGDVLWWGDLELQTDADKIQSISEQLGMYLFVIPQRFIRYEKFNKDMAKNCVFITKEPKQY